MAHHTGAHVSLDLERLLLAVDGTTTHAASQVHREHIRDVNGTLSQDHSAILGLSSQDEHKRPIPENATSRLPESTLSN